MLLAGHVLHPNPCAEIHEKTQGDSEVQIQCSMHARAAAGFWSLDMFEESKVYSNPRNVCCLNRSAHYPNIIRRSLAKGSNDWLPIGRAACVRWVSEDSWFQADGRWL